MKEQCVEDVYSWIDLYFFRTLLVEDQNILVRLSFFEELTEELIWSLADLSVKESKAFIQRLLKKGSILIPTGVGRWEFSILFGKFLKSVRTEIYGSGDVNRSVSEIHGIL